MAWHPPNDPLGAYCRDNHIAMHGSGVGPLTGFTFAVKDAFHIAGTRTGFGQPDWLRTHPPATETAAAVKLLLAAGADMEGKVQCDELCYSLTGENAHYGAPVNVRAPGRVSGGSSCGSAAAVAGGLVYFALGTDCGGSIRIPASYCGLIGLRPTHGRVSLDGALPFAPSFDVGGWLARDAMLFEMVGAVLLGEDSAPAPTRLIVAEDAWALVERPVAAALEPALERVKGLMNGDVQTPVSREGLGNWFEVFRTLQAAEIWATLGGWITQTKPQLGPGVKERIAYAATIPREAVDAANSFRREITAQVEQLLGDDGAICLPTSPRAAPLLNTPTDQIEVEYRNQAMCLLCIAGLAGLPQISLPVGSIDGLPLGLSLIGPRNSDRALIALARRILES